MTRKRRPTHPDNNSFSCGISQDCFGFPASFRAKLTFVHCNARTGKVTVDRYPASGWTEVIETHRQPGIIPPPGAVLPPPPARK